MLRRSFVDYPWNAERARNVLEKSERLTSVSFGRLSCQRWAKGEDRTERTDADRSVAPSSGSWVKKSCCWRYGVRPVYAPRKYRHYGLSLRHALIMSRWAGHCVTWSRLFFFLFLYYNYDQRLVPLRLPLIPNEVTDPQRLSNLWLPNLISPSDMHTNYVSMPTARLIFDPIRTSPETQRANAHGDR